MEQNFNFKVKAWLNNFIHHEPKKIQYYIFALTHKSYSNEHFLKYSYENLEFLGDSIINFLVCEFLYKKYNQSNHEGFLTQQKIKLVQGKTLALVAKKIHLNDYLLLGKGTNKERNNDKILEDAFEALIAAIYLDLGINVCRSFLSKTLFLYNKKQLEKTVDYKTFIQQTFASYGNKNIKYFTKQWQNNCYQSTLIINRNVFGKGIGHKKKEAEQLAAKNAYMKLVKTIHSNNIMKKQN